MKLRITHETRYTYGAPVSLSQHLLYLRPREHHRQRLTRFELLVRPESTRIFPVLDPLDNNLLQASFPEHTDHFNLTTIAEVENQDDNPFDFVLKGYAITFPFTYEPVFDFALGPYLTPPFDDTQAQLQEWLDAHFLDRPESTVDALSALNRLLFDQLSYRRREEHGIQSSLTTLTLGTGACRDFAVLFVEMCRTLGIAARFVSGYLYAPAGDDHRTAGAMHAWAEVYLPGAGWRGLDPTHGIWCDDRFIAVAHGAQAETVNPIQGSYFHPSSVTSQLDINVLVEAIA